MAPPAPPASFDPRDDAALVRDLNRGDVSAFDALYARHRDWVYRLAWRFTGHQDDALDVLQETFLYLLGKVPDLRLSARMTTFLYPVVKHISLNVLARRGRGVMGEEVLTQVLARPDVGTDLGELPAAVAALPAGQREVLLMRFVDDLDLREIAEALHVPLGTVKSRLHNALEALRRDERTRRHFAP
ncbi:MAG: sigma-70 family RNA polymerase sigma factor [Planctomycetes bacterium]|nr:sigma-70 family RNA polymerase sigma factor [Planctomycetota bacterium]